MAEAQLPRSQQTLRVTELTRYLKYLIERDDLLTSLSVRGEVSGISRSPSGHTYFTLKDDASQISCVFFRREATQQTQQAKDLRNGLAVVVHGLLTVYEPRGTYQIYVERVVPQGEGASSQRYERLRSQLEKEGLFSLERKRELPRFPRRIALITSPGSQAYHDVLHRLSAQYPFVTVIEAGASVQGDGAPDAIVMALDIVNRLTDADVVLLVRGGGAAEELAAFNDERLARAIFASRIPVVTGIGHQSDFTIADYVADYRAATPSLAAAAAVPDAAALVTSIGRLHGQMAHIVRQHLAEDRQRWLRSNRALLRARPETRLAIQRRRSDDLTRTCTRAAATLLGAKRARMAALRGRLDALDPLAILARGYAVITDGADGRVISHVGQTSPGQRLRARVSDGEFRVRVDES